MSAISKFIPSIALAAQAAPSLTHEQSAPPIPSATKLAQLEQQGFKVGCIYLPLEQVTRTHVDTNEAAHHLLRRPQTLRGWHCHGSFPIDGMRPVVLNGRLAWSVAAIKSVMRVQ